MTASSREGSPLSDLSSDSDPFEQEQDEDHAAELMPPAKRQKTGYSSMRATPTLPPPDDDALTTISSDTDGEIPGSDPTLRQEEDDTHEQVTICAWTSCQAGDLGNMDALVNHIHNEHIETRQKKYTCEWSDCPRKSMPHASGYALKAHMRSHTREKPFYCALPECDRAFTRSDALAKHMRTVHETEALRPSDPIPKSMLSSMQSQPGKLMSRLKLVVKNPQPQAEGQTPPTTNGTSNGHEPSEWTSSFPPELGFTAEEEARGLKELYRLLRRQVQWAEEEGDLLKKSVEALEELRKQEWIEKEALLDQSIKTDISWHERRKEVLAGLAVIPPSAIKAVAENELSKANSPLPVVVSAAPEIPAPLKPPVEDPQEAAAVLASLHQV